MKKVLITTNVLTLCLILFIFGKSPEKSDQPNCSFKYDYNNEPNIGAISINTAKGMAYNFKSGLFPKLYLKTKGPNTRSVWFTVETLKKFLWQIENKTCDPACNTNNELGVRIYFSEYPDSLYMTQHSDLNSTKVEYAKHLTLFMVPTFSQNNIAYDFDPEHIGNDKCNPIKLRDYFSSGGVGNPGGIINGRAIPSNSLTNPLFLCSSDILVYKFKRGDRQKGNNPGGNNTITEVQNHGGLIPPDPDNGTAF